MMLARDALRLAGVKVPGYEFLQRANAVLGALGVLLFFDAARRLSKDARAGACAAAALALSFSYWTRASEGQAYMAMTFGALGVLWCAARLWEAPAPVRAAALVLAWSGAVLVHAAVAFLAPLVLLFLWLAFGKKIVPALAWIVAGITTVVLPYLFVFSGKEGLFSFFYRGTEYYNPAGQTGWFAMIRSFFASAGLGPLERASVILSQLASGLIAGLPHKLSPWIGACIALVLLWAGLRARRLARGGQAYALAAGGMAFAFLDAFWMGGAFFWAVPWACFLLLLLLAFTPYSPRAAAGVLAAVLALGAWNFKAGILPQSRLENNVGYQRAMFVRDHTVASSWVVISGVGFPNSKVYLAYFARRSREVLEYYLNSRPKNEGLKLFASFLRRTVQSGVPIYLLSDLVDDERALSAVEKAWGVSPAEIRACFGPGQLVVLAAQDPGFKVYLFVPERHRPQLYAALSYSVLTESSMSRLQESVTALKEIARLMSPEERRRAVSGMKATRYGFDLLAAGFTPFMNEASQARALERLARFESYQKTPDFKLRLGNLYKYLGALDDTRRVWREAYEQTKDPGLARDLANLR